MLFIEFFQEAFKERPFHSFNEDFNMMNDEVKVLNHHTVYAQGNVHDLEDNLRRLTGKDHIKVSC